ncbi:MAG: GNAT family N-acetyltransferase [Chryseobacterium sp.]|nr:GNAT family N-acetyltransferase [Chryseobacterium sp.]
MYNLQVIKHRELSNTDLYKICSLKSLRWKYNIEEQLEWIKSNLLPEDFHFLLMKDGELIAYMNFVFVNVTLSNHNVPFLGVGNVCTNKSGEGLGNILMEKANQFIKNNDYKGLLLCKENLIDFYKKFNWRVVHQESDFFFMIYNLKEEVLEFKYTDRSF